VERRRAGQVRNHERPPEQSDDLHECGRHPKPRRAPVQPPRNRRQLETEIFGKRILITDREDWSVAEVVAGYRSQSDAEFSFRQLKDRHVVSFSPMRHWTDHTIRVLALQLAHLMRRTALQAGMRYSVREMLAQLAGIGESVLIYPRPEVDPKPVACSPKPPPNKTDSPGNSG
jgi:hypothetical protein